MGPLASWLLLAAASGVPAENAPVVPRFPLAASGLELRAAADRTRFYDVVGRRSALFGYEGQPAEVWACPLKLVDGFELAFRLADYPVEIQGRDVLARVEVRPEATTLVYAHAAFTVRETLFAPLDEPGVAVLLDVESALPMTLVGTFRPRLRLMWPGGLMTPNLDWDEKQHVYVMSEESRRFVGIVGSPRARDLSLMPYQEEPKDLGVRFEIETKPEELRAGYVPIVFAGSVEGREAAKAAYLRILGSLPALYATNVEHYRRLSERTVSVTTPDPALDRSFAWAKVGVDKGLATNPGLGTGLVAGFRTSGDSERPGFGWFFGRDALWSALALHAYGDFDAARTALAFLGRVQRADGKVPHEISQSAPWLPWFTDYPYPWNSADASPLFVVAHADHWRATGDRAFLDSSWDKILKAWRFTAATDTDGNGLVENTGVGHGWVEGGDLYPPHEEIYLQGVWIAACRALAELADVRGEVSLAKEARARAETTRAAVEKTYWLEGRGFYAFATLRARERDSVEADHGPDRVRRQARLEILAKGGLSDEDTVMPAVPMWWGALDAARAESELDHLGGAALATDWGTRIVSEASELYDPLSYHHGSVWPLFTGWSAMAAYRYGRPHVGYQALVANADLRSRTALGFVTELLSGSSLAAFGRSSHHQVWSEAMVATPLVRGLLGLAVEDGGRTLRFAPQLPADWETVAVDRVPVAGGLVSVRLARTTDRDTILIERRVIEPRGPVTGPWRVELAPAYPLDARIEGIVRDGAKARFSVERVGDVQRPLLSLAGARERIEVVIRRRPGSDVYLRPGLPETGARSEGLRVLRSRAEAAGLRLLLEGRGGKTYALFARSARRPRGVPGVAVKAAERGGYALEVSFEGRPDVYVRREVVLPLE